MSSKDAGKKRIMFAGDVLGTDYISNAEVLKFLQEAKARRKQEDEEMHAQSIKPTPMTKKHAHAMKTHERYLTNDSFPYAKNPGVYANLSELTDTKNDLEDDIHNTIDNENLKTFRQMYRDGKFKTVEEMNAKIDETHELKTLSETEVMMLVNNAPTCVEHVQPMIEEVEKRFSVEEQQIIVDLVIKHCRRDEQAAKG